MPSIALVSWSLFRFIFRFQFFSLASFKISLFSYFLLCVSSSLWLVKAMFSYALINRSSQKNVIKFCSGAYVYFDGWAKQKKNMDECIMSSDCFQYDRFSNVTICSCPSGPLVFVEDGGGGAFLYTHHLFLSSFLPFYSYFFRSLYL